MTYQEATRFLFSQLPMYQRQGQAAYKADLDTTYQLDAYFKSPHKQYRVVHVAGTNGKGSVSHMLAAILQEAGYKVGLYTSPHLKDFRERIKVNGEVIDEQSVVDFVVKHATIIKELKPSFFEMTVAMAFDYFANQNVEVAVVEVGMGGRLDSTNIVHPVLSVITNIDLDHTQFLGSTKALIAEEKGGIIKEGVPVVIGETDEDTVHVFANIAHGKKAPLLQADQIYQIPYSTYSADEKQVMQVYSGEEVVYTNLKVSLLGIYQRKNVTTVLVACDELRRNGFTILDNHVSLGLEGVQASTGLLGRWQLLGRNPRIVCDTGHNAAGVKAVMEQIQQTAYKSLHIIWGMVNDKDTGAILRLLPQTACYYFTRASIPRSLPEEELRVAAKTIGLNGESFKNVQEALIAAQKNAEVNDLIFIGGSTFVVADVL
jgi:dihydrofolate synthase/folylpolyglutamate synthase